MSELFPGALNIKRLSIGRRYRIQSSRRGMILGKVLDQTETCVRVRVEAIRDGETVIDGEIFIRYDDCEWTRLK